MDTFRIPDKKFSKFYWENGYAIVKNLFKKNDLKEIIKTYNIIKETKFKYHAFSTQKKENIELTDHGYIKHPIADVAICDLINEEFKDFGELSRSLLSSEKLIEYLNAIHNNENNYHAVMSMFFDANVGTPPHCDNYYLDSLPEGNLTAVWIALEDINEKAGRFFVLSGSNKEEFILTQNQIDNADQYENYLRDFISDNKDLLKIPSLKTGDIVFWNSKTIHGSTKTIDPSFSRKSFTCHYIPRSVEFVRNKYYPEVRSCYGLEFGKINFRFTSNVIKNEKRISNQKSRSLESFENF